VQVRKAVITAAGRRQQALPVQTLVDRDGVEKSVLAILVEEALDAGVEEVAVVVAPGDEAPYARAAGEHAAHLQFIVQERPLGYGHAVACARQFTAGAPFLHLVGDHLYVSAGPTGCARRLVTVAEAESCSVSAVQATREHLLPHYGAVGGRRVPGQRDLYTVETVIEKPTPTEAELRLVVPGLRAGHYLCFFGMHVLAPAVMELLGAEVARAEEQDGYARPGQAQDGGAKGGDAPGEGQGPGVTLSAALATLATRQKYLALEERARRFDVGVKYGLLSAQLALALAGDDREEVLGRLIEVLAQRELATQHAAPKLASPQDEP
jgi:UTP--glucose-1-phosphate uridylyltransferase